MIQTRRRGSCIVGDTGKHLSLINRISANDRLRDELYFDALDILRPVAKKHGLTESECGLRWLEHHSQLRKKNGDAIIVGASSTHHLEDNLAALDKGPLPEDVVEAIDAGWARVRGKELKFWH